jgi:hypothetical protein
MPRELKPCGTPAAYRRHLRNDEDPCDDCKQAHADAENERNGLRARADDVVELVPPPETDEPLDPIDDARENLRIVNAALYKAVPREVPALSKRRQELVAFIAEHSGKGEATLEDQLAAAREARRAGA